MVHVDSAHTSRTRPEYARWGRQCVARAAGLPAAVSAAVSAAVIYSRTYSAADMPRTPLGCHA